MKEAFHGKAHSVSVCCALSLSPKKIHAGHQAIHPKLCNIFKSFWKIHAGHHLPLLPTEVICSSWRREKFNGDTSLSFKVLLPVKTSPPVKCVWHAARGHVPEVESFQRHSSRQNLPGHSFEAASIVGLQHLLGRHTI